MLQVCSEMNLNIHVDFKHNNEKVRVSALTANSVCDQVNPNVSKTCKAHINASFISHF